ncbi:3-oxoadipyl-CoA thiolase [Hyphobacterium sp. HN65]|uniref:Beta-ketoadipyl-CoA thiolase n=1 Tax=Hyphobacterium lacteum TaxID=3116575 RepID=A0ABU7LPX3_9PROT|nr:3-oxoadipyl-CoA thiolase [Hyphobacterium sp. HN65]MEE2525661.1 3-oxoadipyl-CoA thiolase [Hyphobacterium sp. HN65]
MTEAFLYTGLRTPIGKYAGGLSSVRADDLAAIPIRALAERHDGLAEQVEEVILGCTNQAGEDNRNVARMAVLLSGLGEQVPGVTVNRLCASGLEAVAQAAFRIRSGGANCILAGGIESMSRAPFVMGKAETGFSRAAKMEDTTIGWRFVNPEIERIHGVDSMGETAENLAEEHGISREDQDAFAVWSQQKAGAARGKLAPQITPVSIPQRKGDPVVISEDEHPRPGVTAEQLAKLPAAFRKGGSVTAGNASGVNDGSAAIIIGSEAARKAFGLDPMVRIVSYATAGVPPRTMGIGPVPASERALALAGLSLADMDVIELNEAFAAQVLACTRSWGLPDTDERLNAWGGAIALGHPLGASGARLALTAAHRLQAKGGKYALVTLCVGVGQGAAMVLEKV